MTNADWWARVVQARTTRDELLPQRVWALRKGQHEAAIDLKAAPGIGAEIVLTVDGELQRTRLYRARAGGTGRRDCGHSSGDALTLGWRIVDNTPAERALLEAHGLAT